MSETRYSKDHEWARDEGDEVVSIGITDYAQQELGDIVFIEPPEEGSEFDAGEDVAVIESVKTAAELKTPVSGEVVEVNQALEDSPETVNTSPMGDGWFLKIRMTETSEFEEMLSEEQYNEYLSTLE